jgi:hypothetical protein
VVSTRLHRAIRFFCELQSIAIIYSYIRGYVAWRRAWPFPRLLVGSKVPSRSRSGKDAIDAGTSPVVTNAQTNSWNCITLSCPLSQTAPLVYSGYHQPRAYIKRTPWKSCEGWKDKKQKHTLATSAEHVEIRWCSGWWGREWGSIRHILSLG